MMSAKSVYPAVPCNHNFSLSSHREKAGLSITQIAETTKISPRFLRAVEDGCFDQLPGGIFNTSYIRQYAQAIGIDPNEALKAYYQAVPGAAPPECATPAKAEPAKESNRMGLLRWLGVSTAASRF